MPHIHEKYDFVVSVFIVHAGKVLLVRHRRYNEWLPIGGHIEMDEDPGETLRREIAEECGLRVRVLAETPKIGHKGVKPLPTPSYLDAHVISATHKHIAFVYFAVAAGDRVKLHEREHESFRWVSRAELGGLDLKLTRSIRFYCERALAAARQARRPEPGRGTARRAC